MILDDVLAVRTYQTLIDEVWTFNDGCINL